MAAGGMAADINSVGIPSKTHSIFIDPYDLTMKTACASSENHLNLRIKTYLNGALTSTMAVKQRVSLGHEKS
jgi:hypothetical protein